MIKDCPIHKKKLAAKKPGQKHPFGHSTCQEMTTLLPKEAMKEKPKKKIQKMLKKICILEKETR